MAKKNTDTVPAMLTPGEFVIKKKSAKKIGYGKLNQMNKTGKVNTKKEAKMPQGKGTYGSKVGRPPKKAKGYAKGGKVKKQSSGREFRKGLEGAPDLDNDLWARFQSRGDLVLPKLVEEQRAHDAKVKVKKAEKIGLKYPESVGGSSKPKEMQFGGKVTRPVARGGGSRPIARGGAPGTLGGGRVVGRLGMGDDVEFDEDSVGGMSTPGRGPVRGYSKGGKVSGGCAVHGASDKYKVGE